MDRMWDEDGSLCAEITLEPSDVKTLSAGVDLGWTPPATWFGDPDEQKAS